MTPLLLSAAVGAAEMAPAVVHHVWVEAVTNASCVGVAAAAGLAGSTWLLFLARRLRRDSYGDGADGAEVGALILAIVAVVGLSLGAAANVPTIVDPAGAVASALVGK